MCSTVHIFDFHLIYFKYSAPMTQENYLKWVNNNNYESIKVIKIGIVLRRKIITLTSVEVKIINVLMNT